MLKLTICSMHMNLENHYTKAIPFHKKITRTVGELIKDFNKNRRNWKFVGGNTSKITGKKYKGGKSIEKIYENKITGEMLYMHILKNKRGKIVDQHFRGYGK